MSKYKIKAHLASLRDSAQFRDPFGLGWTATVKRREVTGFQKWLQEKMAHHPAYRNINLFAQKSNLLKQVNVSDTSSLVMQALNETVTDVIDPSQANIDFTEGVKLHLLDHLAGLVDENGSPVKWSPEESEAFFAELEEMTNVIPKTLTEWSEICTSEELELHQVRAREYSEALAVGVPGQPKRYVTANPQIPVGGEKFELPTEWDGDTVPFGGQPLGVAIIDWLMWSSLETEKFRAASLEAVRGNSETSSDRASVASAV